MGLPAERNGETRNEERSLCALFRFADRVDSFLMALGTLGAIGDGCATNVLLLFASSIMDSLGYDEGRGDRSNFMREVDNYCLYFVYLAAIILAVGFMEGYCWRKTSERQVLRLRYAYVQAVLRQEVGFLEAQEASEIVCSISKDTTLIQEVLGEKVPSFVMNCTVFFSGLIFSAYFSWRLSVAASPFVLLLVVPGLLYGKYLVQLSRKSHDENSKANAIVEQAVCFIKTVYSSTAEKSIAGRYASMLDRTVKIGHKEGIAKGLAVGSTRLSFAVWAFVAWYGSMLVVSHGERGGRIYAAGIAFVQGGLSLGVAIPELKHFADASVAATRILERIRRVPLIDAEERTGLQPEAICGKIEFECVRFAYPARPETVVLDGFSLEVPAGKTVALVGSSGSGKSTVVALVQRFYDVSGGSVKIDGVDLRELRLKWIRGKMGLVSQDHALFATSIRENILLGKPSATMEEITAAAVVANAHSFITQLPLGYETKVGDKGSLLSGGQKQRIAIARAVIRNPAILLLDEATSALDSASEKLVQNALEQASTGRTTLVVAHKLSTVRNANFIAVIDGGKIVEMGSHESLVSAKNGLYAGLVRIQEGCSSDHEESRCDSYLPTVGAISTGGRQISPKSRPVSHFPKISDDAIPTGSLPPPSFSRLLAMSAPEWKQGLAGSLSALVFGAIHPIYAFSIGGMIAAFYLRDAAEMHTAIQRYSLIFAALSVLSTVVTMVQHHSFAYMGENLTRRIRIKMMENILKFEVSWFDEEQNSSGALCGRLSNEAAMVKPLVAERISLLLQTASGATIAMTMGLLVAWKLAIVMIAVQPLTIFCHYAKVVVLTKASLQFVKEQNRSCQIACEAVRNHRIVSSMDCSGRVLQLFEESQDELRKASWRKSMAAGLTMGFSPFLAFTSWAFAFWYGGKLAQAGEISSGDVFKTFFILVSTGKAIAEAGTMTSDLAKGAAAVASVFRVLDRKTLIPSSWNNDYQGEVRGFNTVRGKIEMEKVYFAYPSRPQRPVLRNFCLEVKAGTSVGLVGRSGCGKSTVISLIQRFYDVNEGTVKIDGVDIRQLDLYLLRCSMALVGQEPAIFSGSIRDNIRFGKHEVSEDEIVTAATSANAHEFIASLKQGYDTNCGERGVQLSGGQKQRIAIARAILRDPAILLLDEATSALDSESEQAVQKALERMMKSRTTVVVAHRLNTVQKIDSIALLVDGRVTEKGTYSQLMKRRGIFFKLATLPS